jgi:uncharacterized protein YmfQ (DUF2313 family)
MAIENDYLQQAQALLPHGPAWTRSIKAFITRLLAALANVFYLVEVKANELAKNINPAEGVEFIEEWERVCGLPDECTVLGTSLTERQENVLVKLNGGASPTLDYFRRITDLLGYDAGIDEIRPFICNLSECGGDDELGADDNIRNNAFMIYIRGDRVVYFRTGLAVCGDRLGTIKYATDLECMLNKLKPAHLKFIYNYESIL